jgi:multisubunit Na+/H+ antiporter MnhG subunit
MTLWVELIVCFLLLTGGIFLLIGSIGLVRLPDFFTPPACSDQGKHAGYWQCTDGVNDSIFDQTG